MHEVKALDMGLDCSNWPGQLGKLTADFPVRQDLARPGKIHLPILYMHCSLCSATTSGILI